MEQEAQAFSPSSLYENGKVRISIAGVSAILCKVSRHA